LLDEEIPAPEYGDNVNEDSDDDDDEYVDFEEPYLENFNMRSVPVPRNASPFDADELRLFQDTMTIIHNDAVIPSGYGVRDSELASSGGYDAHYTIKSSRRGVKELQISLPREVWLSRAQLWAQGLDVMRRVSYMTEQ